MKELSRQFGQAKKAGDEARAEALGPAQPPAGRGGARGRGRGRRGLRSACSTGLLYLPNIPAEDAPDGMGEDDNVEVRRWWPGQDAGRPEPGRAAHQEVPHWEIGESLQILDMERGRGSPAPCSPSTGARGRGCCGR